MPTVPSNVVPFTGTPQARPKIDETFLAMAAADLHEAGRLFEDLAAPTKAALASGAFQPSTSFEAK